MLFPGPNYNNGRKTELRVHRTRYTLDDVKRSFHVGCYNIMAVSFMGGRGRPDYAGVELADDGKRACDEPVLC